MHETKIPKRRLVVSDAALAFVARGGRIFARQVIDADLDIVEGEDVLVVDKKGNALTVAMAVV
jgi:predicted RNA-binding protein (TIGR00451 family)